MIQGKFSSLVSLRVTGLTPAREPGSWCRTRTSELSHQRARVATGEGCCLRIFNFCQSLLESHYLKIPWSKKPGRLQSMGSPRVGHDLATKPWLDSCPWGWFILESFNLLCVRAEMCRDNRSPQATRCKWWHSDFRSMSATGLGPKGIWTDANMVLLFNSGKFLFFIH